MITLHIPIRTVSEANRTGEHWTVKAKRKTGHKQAVAYAYRSLSIKPSIPCKITMTRIAPRPLDQEDNLPMAFKYIKDQIAIEITGIQKAGKGDSHPGLTWLYHQQKGKPKEYAIMITFETNP